MGERGSGSRYGGICGGEHSPLVELDGSTKLSRGETSVDHRGFRRQQRRSGTVVEMGTAATGRRNGLGDFGVPFSTRHQQVEQDRTSSVLLYQPELARQTLGQP